MTVAELIAELSKFVPDNENKVVVVYHSDSDMDFSVSGVEMNYDSSKDGDVLITIDEA